MKVSLQDIQSAFFGDDVPRKNITLRRAHDEIVRLRAALTDVTKPLEYLRRHAEADGNKLNGMAFSVANDLPFVQKIAKDALEQEPPPPQSNLEASFTEALKILNGLAIAYGSLPTSITGAGSWHSHAVAFLDRHRDALASEGQK